MRFLHLSDLHVTGDFKSYEDAWAAPSNAIGGRRFDAIVLSGDLTQRAGAGEYTELLAFITARLLPLIDAPTEEERRRRLIAVPGNHDVEWGADIWEQRSILELTRDDPHRLASIIESARRRPLDVESLRVVETRYGHIELFRPKAGRYADRLRNVQGFFDALYGVAVSPELSPFALTADTARHWSAHVLRDLGVAFYGFNSCVRNDRHWTGASIDAAAVQQASAHMRAHCEGMVCVAVWHHGLDAEHGRSDAITVSDLARLVHAGFRVGLHGHIHRDQVESVDTLYQGRFVRLAVGTINADRDERQELVGRQFAVVQLYPGQLQVQVFEQSQRALNPFEARPRQILPLVGEEGVREVSEAVLHRRTWTVDDQGVARVSVHFEGLAVRDDGPLALPTPPYNRDWHQPRAAVPQGTVAVQRQLLADGRVQFFINDRRRFAWFDWAYLVSAAFAVFRGDDVHPPAPEVLSPRARQAAWWRPAVEAGEEVFCHTVRVLTERLELVVALPDAVEIEGARAVVERADIEQGAEVWRVVPSEVRRCVVRAEGARRVTLAVDAPSLGLRYAIVVGLKTAARRRSAGAVRVAEEVLDLARKSPIGRASLVDPVRDRVRDALQDFLNDPARNTFGHHTAWHVLLWKPARHAAFAALGEFPSHGWNVRFAPGFGVAGHALRFHRPCCWHRDVRGDRSLIFQEHTDLQSAYSHAYCWVVCAPILDEGGAAVGIFSVAGPEPETHGDKHLARLAEDFARGQPDAVVALDQLTSAVSVAFWSACASLEALDSLDRDHARQVCNALLASAR